MVVPGACREVTRFVMKSGRKEPLERLEADVDGHRDGSEREDYGEDAVSRLLDAVARLERTRTPEAAEALARAAEAVDPAVKRREDTPRQGRGAIEKTGGARVGLGVGCLIEDLEFADGQLDGSVTFLEVSPEGNSWVDAGSVTAVLQAFLSELAHRLGSVHGPAAVAVDFLSLTPRKRKLVITARAEQTRGRETRLYAFLSDSTDIVAKARARFVQD